MTHIKKETSESFQTYKDIYHDELNCPFPENKFNLEINETWKNSDGSVVEEFDGNLESWRDFNCVCYECLKEFGSPYDLMMHFKSQHPEIKQKYSCKMCSSKPFLTMKSMIHHGVKQHSKSLSYRSVLFYFI